MFIKDTSIEYILEINLILNYYQNVKLYTRKYYTEKNINYHKNPILKTLDSSNFLAGEGFATASPSDVGTVCGGQEVSNERVLFGYDVGFENYS